MILLAFSLSLIFLLISNAQSHEAALCIDLCPPCFEERIQRECPQDLNCPNKVKEPGCGCCTVCAKEEGERCGMLLPSCGPGLKCVGRRGEGHFSAMLNNRGICKRTKLSERSSTSSSSKTSSNDRRRKSNRRQNRKRNKKSRRRYPRHPHHGLLSPLNSEGPCSKHYEDIMTSCKTLEQYVWIPTCNRRGNYAPKQCMTSTGNVLGECWCVNEIGEAMENTWTNGPLSCTR